jgi:hypothetical protein
MHTLIHIHPERERERESCTTILAGCRLINLWKWLEKPSLCAGLTFDTSIKQTIWTLLLSSGCLLFEVPGSGCVDSTDDSLQDLKDAENFNVNIIGSESLRESFLGTCNFRHSDAKLSTIQRSILERLGEARYTYHGNN